MAGVHWGTVVALAAVGAVLGGAAGFGLQRLAATIRRGTVLPVMPMVAAGAVVVAASTLLTWGTPRVGLALWLALLLVGPGAVDLARHRLPDLFTLPAIPLTALVVVATDRLQPGAGSVLRALLASAVLAAIFGALWAMSPRSMGLGDVKLMPSLGLATGYLDWPVVVIGVVVAFGLATLVALAGLLGGRLTRHSSVAFGPYLAGGAWAAVAVPALSGLLTGAG